MFKQDSDKEEIKGHLLKAEHNLRFIFTALKEKFYDWALTGCYYSCYHAALDLMQTREVYLKKSSGDTLYYHQRISQKRAYRRGYKIAFRIFGL